MYHSVYGFDAQGKQLWHVSAGSPSPAYQRPCGDINPLGVLVPTTGGVVFVQTS
jgi:outer membrane protein assembly factor BamB